MMFFWLFGCTTETITTYTHVSQREENAVAEQDTSYLGALDPIEVPTQDDIETVLQSGVEQVRSFRVGRILDVYDTFLELTDATCPRWFNNPDGMYWADTCTSEEGVQFDGFATSIPLEDTEPDAYGNLFTGRQIHCEGSLQFADTRVQCVGGINELTGVDANGHDVFYTYSRPYVLTIDTEEILYPDLEMWAVNAPNYKAIYYNGVQVVENETGIVGVVQFDEQTFNSVDCTKEPNGRQHIQVDGVWVYVEWQGDTALDDPTCDGCGDGYVRGEPIGEVCADFDSWLAWNDTPFD